MDNVLTHVEAKVDELLKTCEQLRHENARLRMQHNNLLNEYKTLQQKHERAVAGVESMIGRLKKLEQVGV